MQAATLGQLRKMQHLLTWTALNTNLEQIRCIHAGKHRHANQQHLAALLFQCFAGGTHHTAAAGCMNIGHPHTQICCCTNCLGGCVGDIVKFEIEKNIKTAID